MREEKNRERENVHAPERQRDKHGKLPPTHSSIWKENDCGAGINLGSKMAQGVLGT